MLAAMLTGVAASGVGGFVVSVLVSVIRMLQVVVDLFELGQVCALCPG